MTKNAVMMSVLTAAALLGCSHDKPAAATTTAAQVTVSPPPRSRAPVVARGTNDNRANPFVRSPADGWQQVNGFVPIEEGGDSGITASIRRSIAADDRLSLAAKNVMIVTRDGVVTLIGRVADEEERETVGDLVRQVQGVRRIDDQLEVRP